MISDLEILEDIIDYKKTVDNLSDLSSSLSTEEKLLAFTNLTGLKQDILTKITLLEKQQSDNNIVSLNEDKPIVVEEPVTIKEEKTSLLDKLFRRK